MKRVLEGFLFIAASMVVSAALCAVGAPLDKAVGVSLDKDGPTSGKSISLEYLLLQLDAGNKRRNALLAGYSVVREYQAANAFTHTQAQMQVKMIFRNPSSKEFTVVSEAGSKIIRSRVFRPALAAEQEAVRSDLKLRSTIGPDNY